MKRAVMYSGVIYLLCSRYNNIDMSGFSSVVERRHILEVTFASAEKRPLLICVYAYENWKIKQKYSCILLLHYFSCLAQGVLLYAISLAREANTPT